MKKTIFMLAVMLWLSSSQRVVYAYTTDDCANFVVASEAVLHNVHQSGAAWRTPSLTGIMRTHDLLNAEILIRMRAVTPEHLSAEVVLEASKRVYPDVLTASSKADFVKRIKSGEYDANEAAIDFYKFMGGVGYKWSTRVSSMDNEVATKDIEGILRERLSIGLTQIAVNYVSEGTGNPIAEAKYIPIEDFHETARQLFACNVDKVEVIKQYLHWDEALRNELIEINKKASNSTEFMDEVKSAILKYPTHDMLLMTPNEPGERKWQTPNVSHGYVPCMEILPIKTTALKELSYDLTSVYYRQHVEFLKKESMDIIEHLKTETEPSQVKLLLARMKYLSEYSDYAPFNYNAEYGLDGNPSIHARYEPVETFYDKNVRYAMSTIYEALNTEYMPSLEKVSACGQLIDALFDILPLPSKI